MTKSNFPVPMDVKNPPMKPIVGWNFGGGWAAVAALLLLLIGTGLVVADNPTTNNAPTAAKPFDHGDDVNSSLYKYRDDATVPKNPVVRPLAKLELKDKIYHGVLLNTDTQAQFDKLYAKYVALVGKKPTMIGTFHARWSNGVEQPEELFYQRLVRIGAVPNVVPFIKLYTCDWKVPGPMMKADDILAGKEDAYFIHLAEMSKKFGKPFLLSIDHEMNGNWFSYSENYNRGGKTDWTAEKFVLIWRKIYKIFQDNGATNVAFAWCPGANGKPLVIYDNQGKPLVKYDSLNSYKAYYPGDDYVDWVGASFYNDVNHSAMDNLAATYPNKPIILAEWGTEAPRGAWYQPKPYPGDAQHMQMTFDLFTTRYPNMKAMTYFEWGPTVDIDRVPKQVEIYKRGISNPIFFNNN
jgi:hypothetical protein